jgi:hypothetical protein
MKDNKPDRQIKCLDHLFGQKLNQGLKMIFGYIWRRGDGMGGLGVT